MRQAGRYMAEYRAIRARHRLLDICRQPELAAEVSLQPVRALGVDAAILFSDILLPLEPMGAGFEFEAGEGPVFHHAVREARDVAALRIIDPEADLRHVLETLRLLRAELDGRTPLIGFAGGPFTLASYLVEGGKSQHYAATKRMLYGDPGLWHALLEKLAEVVRRTLLAQIRAGAQAVQLFDSWVGALAPRDYSEFVLPHVRHILQGVAPCGVPVIHFGTGTGELLELMHRAGGTVLGVDWRTPLEVARRRVGAAVPLQGNLDPLLLGAPRAVLETRVVDLVEVGRQGGAHIFNLGHGVLPDTDPDRLRWVVDLVHERSAR
jgi:uroporphyrinogen decarboxylase